MKIKLIEFGNVSDKILDVYISIIQYGRDKDLDILINDDKNPEVCAVVARCGRAKDLDIFISDKDYNIKTIIIDQSYGLDAFIKYEELGMKKLANMKIKKLGFNSVEKWAKANPDKCAPK